MTTVHGYGMYVLLTEWATLLKWGLTGERGAQINSHECDQAPGSDFMFGGIRAKGY